MSEYVRDIKITVEVDTNKRTLTEEFDNREDFENFWRDYVENINE
jgi:hypothetical protein